MGQNFAESVLQTVVDIREKNKPIPFSKLKINAKWFPNADLRKKWTSYMSSVKNAASNNRRDTQKKGSEELTRVQDKVVEMFEETPKELTQTLDNLVK